MASQLEAMTEGMLYVFVFRTSSSMLCAKRSGSSVMSSTRSMASFSPKTYVCAWRILRQNGKSCRAMAKAVKCCRRLTMICLFRYVTKLLCGSVCHGTFSRLKTEFPVRRDWVVGCLRRVFDIPLVFILLLFGTQAYAKPTPTLSLLVSLCAQSKPLVILGYVATSTHHLRQWDWFLQDRVSWPCATDDAQRSERGLTQFRR
jgi:hypothetical protein